MRNVSMFNLLSCLKWIAGLLSSLTLLAPIAAAEMPSAAPQPQGTTSGGTAAQSADQRITELSREVENLKNLVHQLQAETSKEPAAPVTGTTVSSAPAQDTGATVSSAPAPTAVGASGSAAAEPPKVAADLLRGMTINAMLDGYYEYNTNAPVGRVNYLRAYDVSSNSFSLNQADLVVESAPDPTTDKRVGMRLDLQYGQATSTLQGNPANELRPDVHRAIFQAYGTYVFPVGKGLTVDFGKWASSLGIEGNYTKDQLNYSRSYWFNYLPFYHTGIRAKYVVNDKLAINAWITNGTQQTEAFNNYKDQLLGFVLTPTTAVTWTFNYYQGQEHPDVIYLQSPGPG